MQRVAEVSKDQALRAHSEAIAFVVVACALVIAPMFAYPAFLMKALCFELFACAFHLLIGYVGLLSFGHALFFGWASYLGAHAAKVWGFPPELAILSGTATGAGLGAIVGALAIRRQGIRSQFCASPGRKLVDLVMSNPSDRGLVTSYSPKSFRNRCEGRHRSRSNPKESSGYFWRRPVVFSPSHHGTK